MMYTLSQVKSCSSTCAIRCPRLSTRRCTNSHVFPRYATASRLQYTTASLVLLIQKPAAANVLITIAGMPMVIVEFTPIPDVARPQLLLLRRRRHQRPRDRRPLHQHPQHLLPLLPQVVVPPASAAMQVTRDMLDTKTVPSSTTAVSVKWLLALR